MGISLISLGHVYAQANKADEILNKLSAKTKAYHSISASFKFKLEDEASNTHSEQDGTIKIEGNKYYLVLGDNTIISNGTTRWTYNRSNNEVYIDNIDTTSGGDNGMINPSHLFSMWETGFKRTYDGMKTIDGKSLEEIRLFPNNPKGKSYHTIKLYIDGQKNEIARIVVMGKDGQNFTYIVKSFEGNGDVPASLFEYNPTDHPHADVIDNR